MLVLTRRVNESIKIGEDITVHLYAINGNQIKIGIQAPRDINIVRDNCKKDRLKNPINPINPIEEIK
jgi:carbon storage regulator CsrA